MKSIKIVAFCGTNFVKLRFCMKTAFRKDTWDTLVSVFPECRLHAMHQSYENGTTKFADSASPFSFTKKPHNLTMKKTVVGRRAQRWLSWRQRSYLLICYEV